jgi:hypothetical protein
MHRTRSVFPRATKRPAARAPTIDATALRKWISDALHCAAARRNATVGAAQEFERVLGFGILKGRAKRVVRSVVESNRFATENQWGRTFTLFDLLAHFFPDEASGKSGK